MSIRKMITVRKPAVEPEPELEDWPAEIGHGYPPMPVELYSEDTFGIFDRLLWDSRGIAGGPAALFDAIHAELSGETQAWLANHQLPLFITSATLTADSFNVTVMEPRHRAPEPKEKEEVDNNGDEE